MSTRGNQTPCRPDGRRADELRTVRFQKHFAPAAAGSVLVHMGRTRVLCGVSIEPKVPPWMRAQGVPGGWITAEYSMLPYASAERTRREASAGRVGGRTQEIQRLIGRSLRAVVDLRKLGTRTCWVDCDVIQADGGTRTAAITGGYVALRLALTALLKDGTLDEDPVLDSVAAISVGIVGGRPLLDLCYEEDAAAEVDMNVVMTGRGRFIEIQGTAEEEPFSRARLDKMLSLGRKGIAALSAMQRETLGSRP